MDTPNTKTWISEKTDLRRNEKGLARYTTVPIKCGEIILTYGGEVVSEPDSTTIQMDATKHLRRDGETYVNHSCEPTAYIEYPSLSLRALTDIHADTEITFDYTWTEYNLDAPFTCSCKTVSCKGEIRGFKYLSPAEQRQIPHPAPFLADSESTC